jgi:hypothetical protein
LPLEPETQLEPLRQALLTAELPRTVLTWLRTSPQPVGPVHRGTAPTPARRTAPHGRHDAPHQSAPQSGPRPNARPMPKTSTTPAP